MPSSSEQSERLLDPMCSSSPSTIIEASESEMYTLDVATLTLISWKKSVKFYQGAPGKREPWLTDRNRSIRDSDTLITDSGCGSTEVK
eukprot:g40940.t1